MQQEAEHKSEVDVKIKKTKLFCKTIVAVSKSVSQASYYAKKYYQQVVDIPKPNAEQLTAEITEKSNQAVNNQKTKKKRWLNIIFLLINIGIVVGIILWNVLGNDESMSFSELLTRQINWEWLFFGVVLFVLVNFADSARIFTMILYSTKRPRPFLSYKSVAMCRFYDCATPMATGGQPFQIFYLNKRGLPAGTATSVPIAKYLYSQFYTILFMAVVLICKHAYLITLNPWVLTLAYITLGLNLLLIAGIIFLSVSKKIGPSCAVGILKFLSKIKIVKDYRKSFVKVMKTVREYSSTMKMFVSNIWIALFMLLFSVVHLILNYSLPFVVYATFMPLDASWFEAYVNLFTIGIVCDMACGLIPLPGGSGMAEISFAALVTTSGLFVTADGYNIIVWALLLWRIFSYYGYLIQGLFVSFYDSLIGNKKIAPLLERFKKEDLQKEKEKQNQEPVVKVVKNRRRK